MPAALTRPPQPIAEEADAAGLTVTAWRDEIVENLPGATPTRERGSPHLVDPERWAHRHAHGSPVRGVRQRRTDNLDRDRHCRDVRPWS